MKGHIHAELMAQYAEDAKTTDKPWDKYEIRNIFEGNTFWVPLLEGQFFKAASTNRRKNKMKLIHGVEVPNISFTPKDGEYYYAPAINRLSMYGKDYCGHGCVITRVLAEHGCCYPDTEEGKQAAILHAKAMLGIAP